MNVKHWKTEISIAEQGDVTRAEAILTTPDNEVRSVGTARRNPKDMNVPEIGDELATARALADLSHRLLELASADIEQVTSEPAHLRA